NTSNVTQLTRAWTFHTKSGRFAGAPMIVGNVMYFSAPNGVYALDATTGTLIWRYPVLEAAAAQPSPAPAAPPPAQAARGGGGGFASVGSALFGDGRAASGLGRGGADAAGTATRGPTYWQGTTTVPARIFSLLSGGLAAIDAKTGTIVKTFGENGLLPGNSNNSPPVI